MSVNKHIYIENATLFFAIKLYDKNANKFIS